MTTGAPALWTLAAAGSLLVHGGLLLTLGPLMPPLRAPYPGPAQRIDVEVVQQVVATAANAAATVEPINSAGMASAISPSVLGPAAPGAVAVLTTPATVARTQSGSQPAAAAPGPAGTARPVSNAASLQAISGEGATIRPLEVGDRSQGVAPLAAQSVAQGTAVRQDPDVIPAPPVVGDVSTTLPLNSGVVIAAMDHSTTSQPLAGQQSAQPLDPAPRLGPTTSAAPIVEAQVAGSVLRQEPAAPSVATAVQPSGGQIAAVAGATLKSAPSSSTTVAAAPADTPPLGTIEPSAGRNEALRPLAATVAPVAPVVAATVPRLTAATNQQSKVIAGTAGASQALPPVASFPPKTLTAAVPVDSVILPKATDAEEAGTESIVGFVREHSDSPCFAAVVDVAAAALTAYGGATDLGAFAAQAADHFGARATVATEAVAPGQCALLDFLKDSHDYPTLSPLITLDVARVSSGGTLVGAVTKDANEWVYVILVDDDGRTQNLDRYLMSETSPARLAAPVTAVGSGRHRQQLLLAIGSQTSLVTPRRHAGEPADQFFSALVAELETRQLRVSASLASFEIY